MYPRIGNAAGSSKRSIGFFFWFFARFSLGNRAVTFFSLLFLLFMTLRPADVVFSVVALFLVSAFSFGVYTPLEVISDRSLTTPYNVLNCILRVLRTTNVCEDIVPHTEYSMFLVKWPTYWKQTTLFTTQV